MIKFIEVLVCTYKDKYFNTYKVNVLSVKTLVVSSLLGPFLEFCFISFIRRWSAFPSCITICGKGILERNHCLPIFMNGLYFANKPNKILRMGIAIYFCQKAWFPVPRCQISFFFVRGGEKSGFDTGFSG